MDKIQEIRKTLLEDVWMPAEYAHIISYLLTELDKAKEGAKMWDMDSSWQRDQRIQAQDREAEAQLQVQALQQQLDTAIKALEKMDDRKNLMMPRSQMARIAKETLDLIREGE